MQSYDSVSLSVDRFTHQLLRRLNSNGTPSFYNYVKNKKPIPSSILDLGCGEGHWIIDAHASWPEAHIVGFDLVDVILPEIRQNERLNFVRGNFIRYALPFPHSSFDLVRVSNLSLAIPTERWNFVLSEIHRVLQVGGRLELIDDAVCFPYGKETFAPSPRRQTFATAPNRRRHSFDDQGSSAFDLSNSDDDDAEETDNDHHELTPSVDDDGSSELPLLSPLNEDTSDWANSAKDGKALETVFFNMLETKYGIHTRTPKGITSFMKDTFGADNVRKLRTMHLKLAPSELEELIPQTKRPKFRVRSLSKGTELDTHPKGKEEFGVAKKQPKNGDTDAKKEKKSKKEKEHGVPFPTLKDSTTRSRANTFESNVVRSSSESSAIPSTLSAKAAGRLGITYSALAAATNSAQTDTSSSVASVYSNRSSSSIASMSRVSDEFPRNSSDTQPSVNFPHLSIPVQQSPGLLLLPSTFIPLSPVELEMHACKHMHALLSCKRAISDWLLYNDDGTDNDCISEDSLRDVFFEYDFFRRRRLNWPSQAPEIDTNDHDYKKNIEIPFEGPKSTGSRSSTFSIDSRLSSTSEASIGPYNRHELTHVRTFRVYFAVKTRRLSYSAST
ncbi:hypothetical protein GGU10DRAFT_399312 [Lentinula aff. detonsa]|uniref:Methyltransferase domain-containing protein n=1 Tax=Lentinula aff. detonsa TaxID=2804958 RepID=A0AA38TZ60_9AGAR|nr:hypothetical protein GGU10DRAFT_399312 [Lentinula aff. detonsa]